MNPGKSVRKCVEKSVGAAVVRSLTFLLTVRMKANEIKPHFTRKIKLSRLVEDRQRKDDVCQLRVM